MPRILQEQWIRLSAISNCTYNSTRPKKIGSIASRAYGLQKIASSGKSYYLTMLKGFANYSKSVKLCARS